MKYIIQNEIDKINKILENTNSDNDTFMSGNLGLAYYYYHSYKSNDEKKFLKIAKSLIENIFDRLNSDAPKLYGTTLSSGAAGLGYVINSISKADFPELNIENEFVELDNYLFSTADSQIDEDAIDYLHGALGTVLYFSERTESKYIENCMDSLIDKICKKAIKEEDGYWFKNHFLKKEQDTVNFGLSHGLCGILLILIKCHSISRHKVLIEKIVSEGIRFIRKYKMDINYSEGLFSFFPFMFQRNAIEFSAPNRLAWCYGDLNEVLLFYRAGKLLGDPNLTHLANLIGSNTFLRKKIESTHVEDSHFCHGSSGLAQFYKILFIETGLPVYREAHDFWIEQTILLFDNDLKKGTYLGKECSLLEGMVGVALTLLSSISEKNLTWSNVMLL